ncbi:MAG: hypothetical protein ACI85H_000345 [Paracoccaceae bacterium]
MTAYEAILTKNNGLVIAYNFEKSGLLISKMQKILCTAVAALCLQTGPSLSEISFTSRSSVLTPSHSYDGEWEHYVGGGVAIFDCNQDYMPDLFAAGGTSSSHLYINSGKRSGDISFVAGDISPILNTTGAYPLDVDGDKNIDLLVLRVGENQLLRGDGTCHFTPAPASWGFEGGAAWSTAFSATFELGQNWPTFTIGNYVDLSNTNGPFEACDGNQLLRPNDRGFAQSQTLAPGFCALSMLISDWKRDGTPELRISNDRQYYVRDGREQMFSLSPLREYTEEQGWPTLRLWGMGIASQDITGDGLPEVVLTSMGDQLLQINKGAGRMVNAPYGIGTYAARPYRGDDGRPSTGWHAQFGDINNDGLADLFIAKGNVNQMPSNAINDPNNLLLQQKDGTFVEMGEIAKIDTTHRSRGAGLSDLNLDGLLDLVVINRRADMEVWQNTTPNTDHFLSILPLQDGINSGAIGAFIEVAAPNLPLQTSEVTIGGGHVSGQLGPLHFGVGAATHARVRIIWPDQQKSDWVKVETGKHLLLTRSKSSSGPEFTVTLF